MLTWLGNQVLECTSMTSTTQPADWLINQQEQDLLSVSLGAGIAAGAGAQPPSTDTRPQLPSPQLQQQAACVNQGAAPLAATQAELASHLPAYYVAVEHDAQAVVLVVRGTSALRDLVTDLCAHTHPFLSGRINITAKWVHCTTTQSKHSWKDGQHSWSV